MFQGSVPAAATQGSIPTCGPLLHIIPASLSFFSYLCLIKISLNKQKKQPQKGVGTWSKGKVSTWAASIYLLQHVQILCISYPGFEWRLTYLDVEGRRIYLY